MTYDGGNTTGFPFYLIQSNKSSAQLADAINQSSKFAANKDFLIVINLDQNGYKVLGHCTDGDVHTLMAARRLVVPSKAWGRAPTMAV